MSLTYGVVTIALDSARTIRRTIESVLMQNPLPDEYVLVDGGSTDSTLEIIEEAASNAKNHLPIRFEILHQSSRGGIPEAWNMGLRALKSDVVFVLNSDDWYEPHTASSVLSCFEFNPTMEILLGSGRYFQSESDPRPTVCRPRPFAVLPMAMAVIHPACFAKRNVYKRVGFYDEEYRVAADYEFIYRCHRSGVKFSTTDEILVNVLRGGFAERNKALGRHEMAQIGERYSPLGILPHIARLTRAILNR